MSYLKALGTSSVSDNLELLQQQSFSTGVDNICIASPLHDFPAFTNSRRLVIE